MSGFYIERTPDFGSNLGGGCKSITRVVLARVYWGRHMPHVPEQQPQTTAAAAASCHMLTLRRTITANQNRTAKGFQHSTAGAAQRTPDLEPSAPSVRFSPTQPRANPHDKQHSSARNNDTAAAEQPQPPAPAPPPPALRFTSGCCARLEATHSHAALGLTSSAAACGRWSCPTAQQAAPGGTISA